jgi:aldose 1-epimerase
MVTPHVLENDVWQVGLLPGTGMSTAFGRIRRGGSFVDLMRPTAEASYGKPSDCASFLLVPWSNRVAEGRFVFRGREHQLRRNGADGSAMHGIVREYPWDVVLAERARFVARFDSRRHANAPTPFPFSCEAEFRLDGARFSNRLVLKNESGEAFPAGLGHHPYFERTFAGEGDDVRIEIPCDEYFPLEACLPTGEPLPVDALLDFRAMRPLTPEMKIDECLTGRRPGAPVRLAYARSGLSVSLELDPLFENVVVYVPQGKRDFAIEPVTNANDGFNLYERGVRNSGVFVLEPGEERSASFVLSVEN